MKHKIWYQEDDQITYLEFVGDLLKVDVDPVFIEVNKVLTGKPYRQLIIKMSKVHKVENRETRELSNEGLRKMNLTEVAFVGGSASNRMIAKVLIKTGVIKINGNFFKTYEEATEWLKSKR